MEMGYDRIGSFEFQLTSPDGHRDVARPTPHEGGATVGSFALAARELFARKIVLDNWLNFSAEGAYALEVRFDGAIRPVSPAVTVDAVRVWRFAIRVLPRNDVRLEEKCKEFLAGIRVCCSQATTDAREELAWVRDPVAVPYLEKAIAELLYVQFFNTLVKIGTPEVKEALLRLAQHQVSYVSANAKTALARIKEPGVTLGRAGPNP
jgi:hypothetical protein